MPALKFERRVYLWRLVPRPMPKDATKSVNLDEITAALKAAHEAGEAYMYIGGNDQEADPKTLSEEEKAENILFISDISTRKKGIITFLFTRGDPNVADAAYINRRKKSGRSVRRIPPEGGESFGTSAHLSITTAPVNGVHRACFEKIPGVPSAFVALLIRKLLERHAEGDPAYTYDKVVGKGKKREIKPTAYHPMLDIKKVPSESIEGDLERGELEHVTLIKESPAYGGPDVNAVRSARQKLTLRTKPADKNTLVQFIARLAPWARQEGYTEIQIGMRDLPGNVSASPRFSLEKEDATETLYVRTQRLEGFTEPLARCYSDVSRPIEDKMAELLLDERKW